MAHSTSNPIDRFASDERGTVAMIFSLCIFVIFMIVGLAIDVGRVYQASGRIAASIDAAALAAAKGLRLANLTDAEVMQVAKDYFNVEIAGPGGDAKIETMSVNIDRAKGSVAIDVVASVPMYFAAVGGIEKLSVPRSTVAIYDSKDIEVGLQLDVTGSMGGSKIAALKTATRNLIDVLLPDSQASGAKVRVGFAPFSAGVNVGPYLKAVDGNRISGNNCVYERLTSTNAKTDALPVGNDAFKIRTDLTGAGIQDCPNAQIIPMTDVKATLKAAVNGYQANGSTAGQLGAAWAWYLVSPTWAPIWPAVSKPAAYNDGKTIKTVILMTDGVYNTVGGINWGDGSTQAVNASKLSVDICAGMKAKGVIVYTVGFDLNSAGSQKQRVIDTLSACANQPEMFFRAENGDELDAVFRQIATQIVSLRLSK